MAGRTEKANPEKQYGLLWMGVDVGSTTVKAVVVEDGKAGWQDYQRHNTRQAEKVVEFLSRMETEAGLSVGTDRVFFTGSGAGFIAPLVGGKLIQEVVAVAACVERGLCPRNPGGRHAGARRQPRDDGRPGSPRGRSPLARHTGVAPLRES